MSASVSIIAADAHVYVTVPAGVMVNRAVDATRAGEGAASVTVGAGRGRLGVCDGLVPDLRWFVADGSGSSTGKPVARVPRLRTATTMVAPVKRVAASTFIIDAVAAIATSTIVAAALLLLIDGAMTMVSDQDIRAGGGPLHPTGLSLTDAASADRLPFGPQTRRAPPPPPVHQRARPLPPIGGLGRPLLQSAHVSTRHVDDLFPVP
jgi:hypothetical protein